MSPQVNTNHEIAEPDFALIAQLLTDYAASIPAAEVERHHYIPAIEAQAELMEAWNIRRRLESAKGEVQGVGLSEGEPTGKFRKRPVVVDAVQIVKGMDICSPAWWFEAIETNKVVLHGFGIAGHEPSVIIYAPDGTMIGGEGDWIIRGVKGELYPCKPDIFEATYEPESPK